MKQLMGNGRSVNPDQTLYLSNFHMTVVLGLENWVNELRIDR
ncbi:hypothetical protein [Xenorhabdus bovienii]|nr:hypothetical protein [Xenorhabdus bovienii]